ncbi:hemagglutinin repeat-containing protein, partial [Escherichia coli]|uniref:hemagglutinin repeat-containing protein n=1 Tax=Escherichia coli TaxID=562 RepID=UPI003EC7D36A
PSGNNGYLVPSTDPDSPYLITVNPKLDGLGQVDSHLFAGLYELPGAKPGQAPRETAPSYTDEKQFLGSSYFLDRLGLKPEKDYRFLGDAVFDTRYVSNAVLSRTGSRYINGLGSDTEQMRYLMDNAARQQKGLGLEFGVALTAEQIAQLDGSILWWESVTINGQTVMVPKLYLSPEDITLHNGSVITAVASSVTATGNISVNAGRDVALTTATESDYHYLETKKKSGGFLSKKTTHTISEDSASREAGSLLSGNRVTVNAGDNLTVEGSDVVADQDVSLAAGNHVDVLAATSTDTSWRFKETKKSGLMGTGGIGFTIGSSKTTHDRREAGTTQSQSASTIGSTAGNVSITAGKQAHISGSDVIANRDISITGDSVVVDPGHDRRTVDEKFEQKKSGLTVALSGTVGSAINNAVTSAQETKESSDSRLKVLQATKTALSGVQAGQAAAMATATGDPNATGVSLSLTTQKSKSQQHSESDTVSGSTLNAGNNLSVVATGKNRGDNRGDIVIAGSQLKAGGNTSLDAANDVLLSGAANTQKTTGRNSSSGGGVGVSIGAGGNGAGISVFASVNAAKGSEKGNGTEWTETTIDSGKTVTINSGRDTVLNGAQVNGNRIIADVGHDLLISSQQDTSKYDSKQTSVAAGGSFTFGSMTGSGYIAASRDKMKSRFDSVAEQTGMFAGDGGFDITVGRHTQLDGAVIASTATPDKNHLDTGTLGFSDLHNEADYKVSHSGISLSGGGSFGDKFQGNMPGGMISAGGHSGHAEGTTQAAVAEGTITIRDRDNQKQNLANLSRDPVHANDSISPIFDKEKEQRRLQTVGLISDIGSQVADIARTQGELNALKAAQDKYGPVPADATEEQRQAYLAKLRDTPEYKKEQEKYGTGSEIQRGIQAATAALQGLAGGNLAGALAGASAPELAHLLKSTEKDPAVNAIAHAILGGAVAAMQGNNVAAGAAGAATGELAARAIAGMLYPGVKQSDLSEEQKQTISTLATVSAGLAGGLTGNSTASAAVGAQSGKNAVENNYLSEEQSLTFDKELSECRNSGRDCQNVIDKWKKISDEQSAEIDQKLKDNPLEAQVIDKEVAKGGYDMAQRPGWLGNIGVEVMTSDEAKAYVQQWNGRDLTKIDVNSPEWTKFAVFASDPENQAMLVSGGLLVKDITKAAISFMSRNTATATVNASEVGMQWGQGNMKQGMPWEDYVGKSLPADARLPKNFKTFDYYDGATKTATSVKSMDTQTMAKLANPNQVYSSIKGNIDAAAKFKEYALSGRELTSSMISNREIQLAIPADTTKTQWAEINRAIEYGKSQGVKVTVTQVK